jgi:hypothetical protein
MGQRRKVATCSQCGQKLRGLDHSKYQTAKADQSAGFRTAVAELVSRRDNGTVSRKKIATAKERQASRKPRRLLKGVGRVIPEKEYERLLEHI